MMIHRRFSCPAVLALALLTVEAGAQVDRTDLSGTVVDPAGKAIPDVHVTALMPDNGTSRETVTSRTGTYEVPGLPEIGRAHV